MTDRLEDELAQSWARNAEPWTEAVRAGRIESRRLVTDQAIVDAVLSCAGSKILDIGCGEGWLARRLSTEGQEVVGFDGSVALVKRARELGGGSFVELSYEAFAEDPDGVGRNYDVAVSNFSLLGERIGHLLNALRRVVAAHGHLVIQTVHPVTMNDRPIEDGWREESFEPLAPLEFASMPWYFRTRETWVRDLQRNNWQLIDVHEPIDQRTGEAASLILLAEARNFNSPQI